MFKIKLLILLLASIFFISCTKNEEPSTNIKYSMGYIGGEFDGLLLKNLLYNNLISFDLYDQKSKLEIKSSINHSSDLYITNIDNTSDRANIETRLVIDIVDKTYDCIIQTFDKNISQFYIFADSSNYISNNKAVDKIKKENTEALVKNFINTLNNTSYKCKKIDTLQRKLLLIRDE